MEFKVSLVFKIVVVGVHMFWDLMMKHSWYYEVNFCIKVNFKRVLILILV